MNRCSISMSSRRSGQNMRRDVRTTGTSCAEASRRLIAGFFWFLALVGGPAQAQNWPARPVTLVVPFSAGECRKFCV